MFLYYFNVLISKIIFEQSFFSLTWVGQLARTSTNPTGPEVNDHVSLQLSSYEQPQDSNLRPQRKQTSWF
jgi:hypothetical protein